LIAFLDACAIIYQVEAVTPYQQRLAVLLRGVRTEHPDLELAVSRLSWIECRAKPLRDRQTEVLRRYDTFLAADDLVVVELLPSVIDAATTLRAEYGLKTPDALQAACALTLGAGTAFVTNDPTFGRVRGLEVKLL
jgi:predicted nucleic acid-binding protein